jgi:beta-glucanase (GH16 family)
MDNIVILTVKGILEVITGITVVTTIWFAIPRPWRRMPVSQSQQQQMAASSLGSGSATAKPVASSQPDSGPAPLRWRVPLVFITVVQIALSLRLIWANTAFEDEGTYLWAGHMELSALLHGTQIQGSFPSYFSGAPVVYPPIAAIADHFGGLTLARLLSLAFILGATMLLYLSAARLFGYIAGVCAAALFALLGPTQFLSAYATYDAMALLLLALSAYLAIRSSQAGTGGEKFLIIAGIALALADATKYATVLWDPVVIAIAAVAGTRGLSAAGVYRAVRLMAYTSVPAVVALAIGGSSYSTGIMTTTLSRNVVSSQVTPVVTVLRESFTWIWPVIVLVILAIMVSVFFGDARARWLCGVFAVAVILSPLHQAQIGTDISLNKHVDFGAWFGAIAAGYLAVKAIESLSHARRILSVALPRLSAILLGIALPGLSAIVIAANVWTGAIVSSSFFASWPNMASAVSEVDSLLPAHPCPCLMLSSQVMDYYLSSVVPVSKEQSLVTTPYGFEYTAPNTSTDLTGVSAYTAAVKDHYFSIVETDFYDQPQLSQAVEQAVNDTPGYHLASTVTWDGAVESQVWYYRPFTFDEEFSGAAGGSPAASGLSYNLGAGTNNQIEAYTKSPANSYLDGDGHLVIAVTHNNNGYQSARLSKNVVFAEGDTMEARIKLSTTQGIWPAWWLVSAGDRQEIDMLENYGTKSTVQTTTWGVDDGKMVNKEDDVSVSAGWHDYEVSWEKSGLVFYLDGHEYTSVPSAQLKAWGYASSEMMAMTVNLAVGGIAGTPTASTKFPVTMEVDWIRAWKDS